MNGLVRGLGPGPLPALSAVYTRCSVWMQVDQRRMVGIMLLVFARTALCNAIGDVDTADVGTGILNMLVRTQMLVPLCSAAFCVSVYTCDVSLTWFMCLLKLIHTGTPDTTQT